MFYFIPGVYLPNTAATNRSMAYIRHLSELGITTIAVFFNENGRGECLPSMPNIIVNNVWKKYFFKKGTLSYLSLIIHLLLFRKRLKKGDVVYCYEYVNYWKLFLKKGVRVYAEYTENPDVIGLGGRFLYTSKEQFKTLCKKLSGVFVISTALKEYFMDIGVEEGRIHIINIIVDSNRFLGLEKDADVEPNIVYCGSAYNNKDGVDQLIKAFAITHQTHPEVKLYIVGAAPKKEEECSNMQLAKYLGVEEIVVFTGMMAAERIPQILKNATILALDRPDNIQAKYGFPTKLGEYLLTGNPTVLTRVGDLPLFLKDGESALFAQPDNPEDFAAKMNWCLEHPAEAQDIGTKGREVAQQYFSYATETQKMIEVMLNNQKA